MVRPAHPRMAAVLGRRRRLAGAVGATLLVAGAAAVGVGTPRPFTASTTTTPPVNPHTGLPAGQMPKSHPGPQTAAAPAGAHLTYYGGKIISNVSVIQVLYGSGTYTSEVQNTAAPSIASFYGAITNSSYYTWLSEYNTSGVRPQDGGASSNQTLGLGSFQQQVQITPAASRNGATIDDTQIQAEISAQISAGHLPAPTQNTYYAVYFPANKTITQGGSSSGVQFCAYHGTVAAAGSVGEYYYGVLPDFTTGGMTSGCGTGTRFQNESSVSSHELVEATTDAEVGIGSTVGRPLAWYDATNGEIGDICNGQQQAIMGTDGRTYTVQQEFSNRQNNCVVSGPAASNDFSLSLNPTTLTVAAGSSGTSTASTAVTAGSAASVSFTSSGAPAGTSVSFSPTSVTAGGSSTVTVSVGTATAAGTYSITVTGTEGSATHSATLALTVTSTTPTNDFSIALNPASLGLTAGGSGTSAVSTAVTSGSAATVSLSVSGVPSGATATLNPTSVTAGAGSTLSITTTTGTAAGTYTVTVTGVEGSRTHSATLSLTVSSAGGGGGVTNGGFETGTLSGWTSAGTTGVVSSGAQAGTYAARVGGTSPTNGDSSIAQSFTAPAGATGLSFYYDVFCPDSVTYDWATATLADTTAGTTATPLAKTCVNPSSGWKQVTAALTAGHSYTLTLVSHDDNYSGDPTYTLYDQVAVSSTPPPPSGITNGGFETGTFAGWAVAGAATSIVTAAHSGADAGQAGASTPTNGDSTITQTFAAPTGKTTISVFYKMTCPDTVTYDWATITLKDNTAGTTATLLAKTCTTNSWTQVNGSVTAGHSYTLTLLSHDDNYSADPSFTDFDDATLG